MQWNAKMDDLSRRDFLKLTTQALLAISGMLGLGALYRLMGYQDSPPPPAQYDIGPASAYPVGSRKVLPDVPAVLFHTEAGYTAMSLVCTHLGCTLNPSSNGFICPCHGSQFNDAGHPHHGPAKKSLATLPVELTDEGHLIIRTG
jgi:cytochrome b6-f complex iron-sulfur subunit